MNGVVVDGSTISEQYFTFRKIRFSSVVESSSIDNSETIVLCFSGPYNYIEIITLMKLIGEFVDESLAFI